jgi:hypothetical protein
VTTRAFVLGLVVLLAVPTLTGIGFGAVELLAWIGFVAVWTRVWTRSRGRRTGPDAG